MTNGWPESAAAWIADQGENGDYARRYVLDGPMLARIDARRIETALDVGCGEGRFCRMLHDRGIRAVGIDPTEALLTEARRRDPAGDYRVGRAEALEFPASGFDLVVSYLTLLDIPDVDRAIPEMARVLRPGGIMLIANLNSFVTAAVGGGWEKDADGRPLRFSVDGYLQDRAEWTEWRNVRIRNWHRPLSRYMALLLQQGLILRHFAEPGPSGGDPEAAAKYRRVPWCLLMEWEKPVA